MSYPSKVKIDGGFFSTLKIHITRVCFHFSAALSLLNNVSEFSQNCVRNSHFSSVSIFRKMLQMRAFRFFYFAILSLVLLAISDIGQAHDFPPLPAPAPAPTNDGYYSITLHFYFLNLFTTLLLCP